MKKMKRRQKIDKANRQETDKEKESTLSEAYAAAMDRAQAVKELTENDFWNEQFKKHLNAMKKAQKAYKSLTDHADLTESDYIKDIQKAIKKLLKAVTDFALFTDPIIEACNDLDNYKYENPLYESLFTHKAGFDRKNGTVSIEKVK